MRRRFHLTFPERLAGEPIVYTVGQRSAWCPAVRWLTDQGVTVDRLDEDE